MSRLSDLCDGPVTAQTVLANVAPSDARAKKKRRGAIPVEAKPASLLRHRVWTVILYRMDGERVFANARGGYADACAARDGHLASGKYEKAWLILKTP